MLVKCVHNESCRGDLAPTSIKGSKLVAWAEFYAHRCKRSVFVVGFQVLYYRGVTERYVLKIIRNW